MVEIAPAPFDAGLAQGERGDFLIYDFRFTIVGYRLLSKDLVFGSGAQAFYVRPVAGGNHYRYHSRCDK